MKTNKNPDNGSLIIIRRSELFQRELSDVTAAVEIYIILKEVSIDMANATDMGGRWVFITVKHRPNTNFTSPDSLDMSCE